MTLSLLMVTRGDERAQPFISAMSEVACKVKAEPQVYIPPRSGYLEEFLDKAVEGCGDYILRIDDDETIPPAMIEWLRSGAWRERDHWSFPRVALWRDTRTMIVTRPLWPDHQTRLSVKAKSGGRKKIHDGSPFTPEHEALVCLCHHNFLIKTRAEREASAARYEALQPGAGTGYFLPFSVPESLGTVTLADYDGVGAYPVKLENIRQERIG